MSFCLKFLMNWGYKKGECVIYVEGINGKLGRKWQAASTECQLKTNSYHSYRLQSLTSLFILIARYNLPCITRTEQNYEESRQGYIYKKYSRKLYLDDFTRLHYIRPYVDYDFLSEIYGDQVEFYIG